MSTGARHEPAREGQIRSAFTGILETLVASSTRVVAAVLVDEEGEAVDHAGELPAFDVKVAAAHWQIALRQAGEAGTGASLRCVVVEAERWGYVAQRIFGGYVVVVVCRPAGAFALSSRALRQVEVEISGEAGFPLHDDSAPRWVRVQVVLDAARRPAALWRGRQAPEPVQVIERITDLAPFERGFRVRAADGRTWVLVREPSGVWYASA